MKIYFYELKEVLPAYVRFMVFQDNTYYGSNILNKLLESKWLKVNYDAMGDLSTNIYKLDGVYENFEEFSLDIKRRYPEEFI